MYLVAIIVGFAFGYVMAKSQEEHHDPWCDY